MKKCETCQAILNDAGLFEVSYGRPMTCEKFHSKVCVFAKQRNKPCINQVESNTYGWESMKGLDAKSEAFLKDINTPQDSIDYLKKEWKNR